MNNTERKLDALIDALGFDVEDVVDSVFIGCYGGRDEYRSQVVNYKLTKRDKSPFEVYAAKQIISWWEDEPWSVLPEDITFNGRPDFVIKAYEVLDEKI